ncbi:hypothetical protein AURDEDRAFT_132225 [Auricularia subglabra TFB-10046 SS5]|uniref:Uncharacterized protein n=1 Tax=Auricularia subglabra (strain TFB-10046 / SS5) TaxID=717982 RepID=J0WIR0_AURST|nr:hypothetical protein AURDEDRAFT_132225 [Auricularia subglabra TFB-10046 SS5]
MPLREISPLGVRYHGHVKIVITCRHQWESSPVREFGGQTYDATCIISSSVLQNRIPFNDISSAARHDLFIHDVTPDRLIDLNAVEPGAPAIRDGYVDFHTDYNGVRCIKWAVWVTLDELPRHTSANPTPAELDPHRDWPHLGTIEAHVDVFFEDPPVSNGNPALLRTSSYRPQKSVRLQTRLIRRRLIVNECTFFIGDFTSEQRVQLGIDSIPDDRMRVRPDEPLLADVYCGGRERDAVFIRLHVSPA